MISATYVDFILRDLHRLMKVSYLTDGMRNQVQILEYELELLNIYLFCLAKWKDASEKKRINCRNKKHFGFGKEPLIQATLKRAKKKLLKTGFQALCDGEFEHWNNLGVELLKISQHCKPKINEDCLHFFDSSFKGVFSNDDLKRFMGNILRSLHNLLTFKADMILDLKVKIESLKEKLDLFKEVFDFTSKWCCSSEALDDFKIHTQSLFWNTAWLSLLCWTLNETEENMAPKLNAILSDILQEINLSTAEVTRMYVAVLKASKPFVVNTDEILPSQGYDLQTKGMVLKYVQFLLENSQVDLQNDGIQMLHSGLLFLITFLMYPPKEETHTEEEQLVLAQADAVMNEAAFLISSLSAGQFNEGITEEMNCLLHDFVSKVNAIRAEVRKLNAHSFLHSSSNFNFPMANVVGFIESIIENLKEISIPFPQVEIKMIREDLLSFMNFLRLSKWNELQNEHKELKDLRTRIVNVAYQTERAFSSLMYMSSSIWHDMLCLSDVMEQMKLIKGKLKIIEDQHMHNTDAFDVESFSSPLIPFQARIPKMDHQVVGFDDKVEDILDRLLRGSTERDIILIVGMPGIGKTTLAKKVYADFSVQCHFNKTVWCTVSQAYDSKRLLLDILTSLGELNSDISTLYEEDLVEILYRRLKGQKYLIIMDDIWDVKVWNSLKISFPDDRNGSRILFTSRIHNVVLEASPYLLSPLSEEDSWELLEKKLFYNDSCPLNFVQIGIKIAKDCKGLPLAIVLVAGLLKEKIENLDWWKKIRWSLGSIIAKQGFVDPLELSYKHLPDFLKPCFLYFGSFLEDQEISVRKLTQLWVSEGFIPKHDKKSLEVVAKEYLMDLVARSLIIVSKRSSTGGIKACCIHDLLRDFCLVKGKQEKILKVVEFNTNGGTWAAIFNHYRVCFQGLFSIYSLSRIPSAQFVHSLLFFGASRIDGTPISEAFLINLKFLRVLALEKFSFHNFPEEITALVLLRYLGIRCTASIPESIGRLKSLETFHYPQLGSPYVPLILWQMEKLRHVDAGYFLIPPNFSSDTPALENIQTFSSPFLPYGQEAELFLRRIPTVKRLRCHCDQIPKFDFLSLLESLNVTHIRNGIHTSEFYFPSTLKKLALTNFKLSWIGVSAIGKLQNLEVLKLIECSIDGETWNVEDVEFLKLKFLKLKSMDIQQWNVSDDAFPCLECLVLGSCYLLEEIPSAFGKIPTLNMIQVQWCNSTVERSAKQIKEDQLELGNGDLKVLIEGSQETYI